MAALADRDVDPVAPTLPLPATRKLPLRTLARSTVRFPSRRRTTLPALTVVAHLTDQPPPLLATLQAEIAGVGTAAALPA